MLLQITHRTRYKYDPPVVTAHHMLHLAPVGRVHQEVVSHALLIEPPPAEVQTSLDSFGNARTYVSLHTAHEELDITAISRIQTYATALDPHTLTKDWPTPWRRAQEITQYRARAKWYAALEHSFASPMVPILSEFKAYAAPSFESHTTLVGAVRNLMERIHHEFTYESKSTDINTPALEALTKKKGVCQDFAHVMLACCRAYGLAARYVSGYLLTNPPPGQARLIGSDASHAWISVYCPPAADDEQATEHDQGVWFDFDPTNNKMGLHSPGEDYVTLATGRDYSDVSPVRGVIQGGQDHTLIVEVTVEPIE
jgi:transglutaminase-like putative cysteine protease